MSYAVKREMWKRVFAVPTAVVDRHIRMCGEVSLKVLLVILRCQDPPSEEHLAAMLGGKVSPDDVRDAVRYWVQAGVLTDGELEPELAAGISDAAVVSYTAEQNSFAGDIPIQTLSPVEDKVQAALRKHREKSDIKPGRLTVKHAEPDDGDEHKISILGKNRMRLHTQQINQMAKDDENIGFLLQEAQSVLGRPLTPVASDTIVSLYSYYDMAPDIVLMLLQYCVSMEKDSMRYVEKVAASWLEKGIDTHEKAEAEILRATRGASMEGKIKAAFGIYDRKLVEKEQAFIRAWTEEYRFGVDIITLAFERSVEIKGKLDFNYINGILKNWHERGVSTIADAVKEIQDKRGKPPSSGKDRDASYEISELERLIRSRS